MTREHAKKILTHLRNGKSDLMLMDALDMAISALSESENTGEWIYTEDRPEGFCSKCDKDIAEASTPYCPYCGAKMTWVGAIHEPYKKGE